MQPDEKALKALVPSVSDVWVFHGLHQKNLGAKFASFATQAALIPISKTGKNALDFHLSYYMGYITSRNPDARFVVVANDKGYDPMIAHAKELGFGVERRAFGREPSHPAAPAAAAQSSVARAAAPPQKVASNVPALVMASAKKAAVPKSIAVKKPPAKKAPAQVTKDKASAKSAAAKSTPKLAAAPAARKSASPPSMAKIVASLKKMGTKRPGKLTSLRRTVKMLLGPGANVDALTAMIDNLIARGSVSVGQTGDLAYKL